VRRCPLPPVGRTHGLPKLRVRDEVLVVGSPMSVDPIPAVALEHVPAKWADARPLDRRVMLAAHALRLLMSTVRHASALLRRTLLVGGISIRRMPDDLSA